MIKIEKDLNDIPDSLIPDFPENFPEGKIPTESKTTHRRRMELIEGGEYRNEDSYNDRYKCNDIKKKLSSIYYSKCAYCEQRVEQFHIEHYRPKKYIHGLHIVGTISFYLALVATQRKAIDLKLMEINATSKTT